jgi:dihydrolipoamide dehydrogenase
MSDGTVDTFEADSIVIATGTEVISLPGLDFDHTHIINTDDALELTEVPKKLLVVGAGASGLEMATVYSRLGSQVAVVEIMDQILPGMEHELCEHLYKIIKKSGIEIYLDSQVKGYEAKDNKLLVSIDKEGRNVEELYDKVLVTVGRRPSNKAFEDIDVELDNRGYLVTDDCLRTSIKNIYAIGDIMGPPLLAHKATKQGVMVAEIISGLRKEYEQTAIPSCVFTIPPLSSVGLTEKEAIAQGYKVLIGRFPFRALGKAVSMAETEGMVKIVGDENDKLLGVHILGAESSNLIGEAILAIDRGLTVTDVAESIHPHPTLTEAMQEAAENLYKKAIHTVNK